METKVIDDYGFITYYNDDHEIHRDNDLPAVIYGDGYSSWFYKGKYHRINGPSIVTPYYEKWCYYGKEYKKLKDFPIELYLGYIQYNLKFKS